MTADPNTVRVPRPDAGPLHTEVELTWLEGRIEHWIHGRSETILDRRRRILRFAPCDVFAFVLWVFNDFGTIVSRIGIVRAIGRGEPYQTLPFVRPGGEILLRISGWSKVERVLQAIDAVEELGIDPANGAPDHLAASSQPHYRRRAAAALQPRTALAPAPGTCAVMRFGFVITTCLATLFIALTSAFHPAPKLLWNASTSVPIGLYAVRPALPLHVGDLVVLTPPEPLAQFFAARRYLPLGVPLVKHVLALPGQTVCRNGRVIVVDGLAMGAALERDHFGRALPDWRGCRTLAPSEVFVMNTVPPDSLDGRYFGPVPNSSIVGRADPIWTREEN